MIEKYVYILGPNKELNDKFCGTYFPLSVYKDTIKISSEMIIPEDSIQTYVLIDNNDDWLLYYSTQKACSLVIVKDFA